MKTIVRKLLLVLLLIVTMATNATAQLETQNSFGIICKEAEDFMAPEGDNWKITFSSLDSLGNDLGLPHQLVFTGALFNEDLSYYMSDIDSLFFELPDMEYAPGVFEIKEELFKYIVDSDSAMTVYFRMDCLANTKVPKVGQKVICNIYRDKLPYGFMGLVESMNLDHEKGLIVMKCTTLALEDVYDVFYTGGISDAPEMEEIPDSIVEQKKVINRLTRSVFDDMNKDTTIVSSKKKTFVFSIDKELKPQLNKDGPVVITIEEESSTTFYASILINKAQDIKKIRCAIDLKTEGTITVEGSIGLQPTGRKDVDIVSPLPIPIPIIPGLSINFDWGFTWDFFLGMQAKVKTGYSFKCLAGVEIDGKEKKVIWEKYKDVDDGDAISLEPVDGIAAIVFKGEFLGAAHMKVGIGLLGEGLTAQIKLGAGLKASTQVTCDFTENCYTLDDDPEWLEEREAFYKRVNEDTFVKLETALLFDIEFSVANDAWTLKASDWMAVVGLDNVMTIPIFELKAAPTVRKFDSKSLSSDYFYSGSMKSPDGHMFQYDVEFMFLDQTPGVTPDHKPDYVHKNVGVFKCLFPNNLVFNIDLGKQSKLKGRKIAVYPLLYNTFFMGYMVMGKYDEFYIPYSVSIVKYEKDYESIYLQAEFDKDALQNANITKGGFEIYEPGSEVLLDKITVFDNVSPTSNKMELTINRGKYIGNRYDVKAFLYDEMNKRYAYSLTKECTFSDYYDPETVGADAITAVSAVLNGVVHQTVYEEENLDYMRNKFNVGFVYYPGSYEATSPLAGTMSRNFSQKIDGVLKPNTEYTFKAVLVDNDTRKKYYGKTLSFKTKPVFYDFKPSANVDQVVLPVYVDRGFYGVSNKEKYKFVVSEQKSVWEENAQLIVNDEDLQDRNKYPLNQALVRIFNVTEEDFSTYEQEDYDMLISSEKGWEPGRTYYAKAVYDDGKGNKYETEIKEFKIPAPIDNFIEKPESEDAELNADVLYEYAEKRAQITLYYAKSHAELTSEPDSVDVNKSAKWINGGTGIKGMAIVLRGLEPSTKYYYYYKVEKTEDIVTTEYLSPVEDFTTKKLEYKITLDPPVVSANSAILKGQVNEALYNLLKNSLGEEVENDPRRNFMVYFEFALDAKMEETTVMYVHFGEEREWEINLPNLAWDGQFYCRFVAETAERTDMSKRTFKSKQRLLNTAPEPAENFQIQTFDAELDDEWTTLKGKVNLATLDALNSGTYGEMVFGFEYSESESELLEENSKLVHRDTDVTLNKGSGYFTRVLQLKPNTTYYCRSFVYFDGRYVYGNIVKFTTADYDAGLIVPDFDAARMRELKAVLTGNKEIDRIIFFEEGKLIVPDENRLLKLMKIE